MRKDRRRAWVRRAEVGAVALVLLDLGLYFLLVRPLRDLVAAEHGNFQSKQQEVSDEKMRVAIMKEYEQKTPQTEQLLKVFLKDHVPARQSGYSRAVRLVRQLAEHSGVELSSITYKPMEAAGNQPLERLGMKIGVDGTFSGLVNFAHAFETASDFIVLREFTLATDEGGRVALQLSADLYLTP